MRAVVGDDITPAEESQFGAKLRTFRKNKKLTLHELAALSGLSIGLLGQIERGITSPSLRTLSKLRSSLKLPSSFFFDDEHVSSGTNAEKAGEPSYICRAPDRPLLVLNPDGLRKELLHHGGSTLFEFMIISIGASGQAGPKGMNYPSEKGGYVLEGAVDLVVDDVTTSLGPGDSFLFDGAAPHSLHNRSGTPTKVLWIIAKRDRDPPL